MEKAKMNKKTTMTETERLILKNQYLILMELYPKETYFNYYKNLMIVENGYELHYPDIHNGISDTIMSAEQSDEVIDIFQMFEALMHHYEILKDKSGIDISEIIFKGFNHERELEQSKYAEFLCDTKADGRFSRYVKKHLKTGMINSDLPMLSKYKKMLREWKGTEDKNLKKDDIMRIIGLRETVQS